MPVFSKAKAEGKGKKIWITQQGSRVKRRRPAETEGQNVVQNENHRQEEDENTLAAAVWQGTFATLKWAKESIDGVPIATGAISALVWILETCQQFKDNRKAWADLASEIATNSSILIKRCGLDPPGDLKEDLDGLDRLLKEILKDITSMQARRGWRTAAFVMKDREIITGLREKFNAAIGRFTLSTLITLRRQPDCPALHVQGIDDVIASHSVNQLRRSELAISMATVIPPSPGIFHGREDIVDTINEIISSKAGAECAARLAILGPGGIGKTSIAAAVLNHPSIKSSSLFDDRRYFVSCEALTTGTQLMITILFSLGFSKPEGDPLTQLINTLHSISKPSIIVLDNFETCWHTENRADIRMVLRQLAGAANLTIIITMRGNERPDGIKWERLPSVRVLELEAARAAFLDITTDVEPDDKLDSLLRAMDCVPLAVTLLARVAQSTSESASNLLQMWQQEKIALLGSCTGDKQDNIDISIKLSLDCKPMKDTPSAIHLLSILALLPDGAHRSYIPRLTTKPTLVDPALRTLKQVALVYEDGSGRVRILAPIRDFMATKVKPDDKDVMQVSSFFIELACKGNCGPGEETYLHVQQELGAESANVSWILEMAFNSWETEALWEAVLGFSRYLQWSRPNPDLLYKFTGNRTDLQPAVEAQCHQLLGDIFQMQSNYMDAEKLLREAHSEFQAIGCKLGTAQCLQSLGNILRIQSSYGDAVRLLKEAQLEFQAIGDKLGTAQCLQSLGNTFRMQGSIRDAEKLLRKAQSEFQVIGSKLGAAQCLQSLADILRKQGSYGEAERLLREARLQFQAIGSRYEVAWCLRSLGDTLQMQGNYEGAEKLVKEAQTEFQAIGSRLGSARCLQSLGNILRMQGNYVGAEKLLRVAQLELQVIGSKLGAAECRQSLKDISCYGDGV